VGDEFGGLLDSFTLALEAEGKSPKTVENYSRAVVALARWLQVHDRPDEAAAVTAADVRGWLVSLQGHVSPSTEYRNYSGARQFFGWCVREGELQVSPLANVRPPKVPEPRTVMLTTGQLRGLLDSCSGREFVPRRDRAIIMVLADTGMRRAELAGLTLDDLDLRARVAYVTGKGRRPRTVPFGARTGQALDRYLRLRRAHTFAQRPNVWLAEKGRGVLTADGIRQMLERRGRALGLRVHAHMFRHGFADAWLKAGGSPNDLQELAGWRSAQMVSRYAAVNRAERARQSYRRLSPMDAL
jgi:site-specific recombinase XerD